MKIIADDDSPLGKVFTEALAPLSNRDGVIVFLERAVKNGLRQELHGLDDVLAHAPSGAPIVMLAWQSPLMLADDPRFHAALGYPNVAFRRLPEGLIEGLMVAFGEASEGKRKPDPLAIALLTAEETKRDIGILQHDLHSAETNGGERMATWETRARKVFDDKPQTELIELVKQSRKEEAVSQFAGQSFPDTCVDVEGTLFDADLNFKPDVLNRAELIAHGNPITIWTGGDLDFVRKLVRRFDIPYKLIPKSIMRGATVRAVIDDLEESEFGEDYGVRYGTYRQV